MTTSAHRSGPKLSARAVKVHVDEQMLHVRLEDGRSIFVPLAWFPRLAAATPAEWNNFELIGRGIGIHWPDIDEDISVENLLGANGELLMARDGHEPATPPTQESRGPQQRIELSGRPETSTT